MCCHNHRRRRQNGPATLLFSALRGQMQPQTIQQGETLPAYAASRSPDMHLSAQTTGTIAVSPSEKAGFAQSSPAAAADFASPPAYNAPEYAPREVKDGAFIADFPHTRLRVGELTQERSSGAGVLPLGLSGRWAEKLQQKQEKYAWKMQRKAEKYARKEARRM